MQREIIILIYCGIMGILKGWQHCPDVTASWGHCVAVPSHARDSPLPCCAVGSLCPPTALCAHRETICEGQTTAASMGIAGAGGAGAARLGHRHSWALRSSAWSPGPPVSQKPGGQEQSFSSTTLGILLAVPCVLDALQLTTHCVFDVP